MVIYSQNTHILKEFFHFNFCTPFSCKKIQEKTLNLDSYRTTDLKHFVLNVVTGKVQSHNWCSTQISMGVLFWVGCQRKNSQEALQPAFSADQDWMVESGWWCQGKVSSWWLMKQAAPIIKFQMKWWYSKIFIQTCKSVFY